MTITLCVLLWPHRDCEQTLVSYEDAVLGFLQDHNGRVIERVRSTEPGAAEQGAAEQGANEESDAESGDGQPFEIHLIEFASEASLAGYLNDDRRHAMADARDAAIARTQVIRVDRLAGSVPAPFDAPGPDL